MVPKIRISFYRKYISLSFVIFRNWPVCKFVCVLAEKKESIHLLNAQRDPGEGKTIFPQDYSFIALD